MSEIEMSSFTAKTCKRVIENKKAKLQSGEITEEDYATFVEDMQIKLDVFLLADRISSDEYNALMNLL